VSTLCGLVVLEVGGPLYRGDKEVHLLKPLGDVMKTAIKVVKRDDRKVRPDKELFSLRTERPRSTEVIVKGWIIQSRERRRATLSLLQQPVRR